MTKRTTGPNRRTKTAVAAGAIVFALIATGCAPGAAKSNGKSSDSITIGVEAGSPWEAFYGEAAADFTDETGIKVNFESIPHANMHQQFLSDAVSGAGSYDVYTVDQPWLPEFAEKGYLLPLDEELSEDDRADYLPHTLDTVTYNDGIFALPFMVHNTVLYYRTDLFEAAGISAPPTTWEEYRADAKLLTDADAGIWGTMIPGKQDGEVATRFETFMKQSGGDIAKADGTPTIDSPEARSALDLMTGIQNEDKSSPPGLHDLTDIQGQFLEGNLAMAFVWPYLYSMASDPAQSKVSDVFAIAQSPGNPESNSTTFSWSFGVSAASANTDAATKWVTWASSAEVLKKLSLSQVTPVPRQSVSDAIAADTSLSDAQRAAFSVFSDSVAASTTIPMTPAYPQYQEAIAVAVSAVMSGSQDADKALGDAQTTAETAFDALND